ncbi:bifunctional cobalt-precorrin-7 (C(5))-methyltransferase/cobalt-precorrin-6B (C(15))-methyltransferase [Nocardia caishijiensis]|uniref:Precorrin-6Y C5,15-methyltransferase (Decarboxylating) n=1 Tax=Nocardia caishijiensis TaxID=184756 RepID=A0ABQ6YNJ8_9NOCA|nr:bifunctional cobalt-precorrin-7 (C(5))-methyltransferase/cobalt-precorrin-6B (C(15))-methyltransferase [Nocardia caishijiensis]KAF0847145.1 precorrin-6Y C5,15-methyltransferase (decarboxylating) [Nocardia caishijiensis]
MTAAARSGAPIRVVGIGADGWAGLGERVKTVVEDSEVVFGSRRQLSLLPNGDFERVPWPTPLLPALPELLARHHDRRLTVLASGDPMFYGIGVTLARLVGPGALDVYPQPSSASLACARLGWPLAETPVVSVVARPLATVLPELADRRRLLVLSENETTPVALAELLRDNGFGASTLTVLEQLGGERERLLTGTADDWPHPPGDPLNLCAVDCVADPDHPRRTRMPGLRDDSFTGDGQLTKAEVRALTVTALAPAPGELLWDVGGGSGTIAIEWCRTHPACRAVTYERLPARREQIAANAHALGVPAVAVRGAFPEDLTGAPAPDAVFLGGGLTQDGVFDACWQRLRPGGRLVANAVTAESEALLLAWCGRHGGVLRKFQIYRGEPLGGFTAWRPQLPVAQWIVVKPFGNS